jgi:hypothetical protein
MIAAELLAKGGESTKSGPIGLAVILVLCVAAYFLFKSMSKHLKKVREQFDTEEQADAAPSPERAEPRGTVADPVQPEAPRPSDPSP